MAAFRERYVIKLHDTDAAGILFFANQFKMVHDVYELWLERIGYGLRDRIEKKDFYLPIIHAAADFKKPLSVGDAVEITLKVGQIRKTSFNLHYELTGSDGTLVGKALTVHVTTDPVTMRKIELPDAFRTRIEESFTND